MEDKNVNCSSAFFNSDVEEELCEELEKHVMLYDQFDEDLYHICASADENIM